jgi:DNA repair protein RadC
MLWRLRPLFPSAPPRSRMESETERSSRRSTQGEWHKPVIATASEQPLELRTAEDAASLFAPCFANSGRETWLVAYLDRDSHLLALLEAKDGEELELPLRSIIADALRLDAAGLILGHGRPSGDPEPSEADRAATARLAQVAAWLEIRLHDHLIFAAGEWRSIRAMGLL